MIDFAKMTNNELISQLDHAKYDMCTKRFDNLIDEIVKRLRKIDEPVDPVPVALALAKNDEYYKRLGEIEWVGIADFLKERFLSDARVAILAMGRHPIVNVLGRKAKA